MSLADKTTNMLATCGGQTVCLIDCNTGKMMKRFKDNNKYEVYWFFLPSSPNYTLFSRQLQFKGVENESVVKITTALSQ